MAACGSLQQIFENPLPEHPTLLESLSSWNQIKPSKPIEQSSFTELFGELHFKENSPFPSPSPSPSLSSSSSSSSSFPIFSSSSFVDINQPQAGSTTKARNNDGLEGKYEGNKSPSSMDSFSSTPRHQYTSSPMNYESLQLCTEGLGFESCDDVEDLMKREMSECRQYQEEKASIITRHLTWENHTGEFRRSRSSGGAFPPPISCIGKSGKPSVCFQSYRHEGRFVLKEIRIPTQEFLHASREDGRLKLQFVQPNDEIIEEEGEDEEAAEVEENEKEQQCTEDDDKQEDNQNSGGNSNNYDDDADATEKQETDGANADVHA